MEVAFVDRDTRHLVPCVAEASKSSSDHRTTASSEFLANTLELVSASTTPARRDGGPGEQLEMIRTAAGELGVDVWSSGSHPLPRTGQRIGKKTSYSRSSTHPVVGPADDHHKSASTSACGPQTVWPIINALLVNLPHMLALSVVACWAAKTPATINRTLLYRQLPGAAAGRATGTPGSRTWPTSGNPA